MKLYHTIFIIALVYMPGIIRGQYWVAGDTTGYYRHVLEQDYSPETSLEFDMDCDGVKDFELISTEGGGNQSNAKLDIVLTDSVLNLTDWVTIIIDTLSVGDTLFFLDTSLYWGGAVVCQNSPFGYKGACDINNKYWVFRKIDNGDTTYLFMRITAYLLDFTIHEIISECSTAIMGVNPKVVSPSVEIVPNPFQNSITVRGDHIETIVVYNALGTKVNEFRGAYKDLEINVPRGLYLLEITFRDEARIVKQIIKE